MKKLILAAPLVLAACGIIRPPKPPEPNPTPTPPPSVTKYDELLLDAIGKNFVDTKGQAVQVKGFNSCCTSEDPEPSPDWSLISPEYIDYLIANGYGKDLLIHMRLGPWTPQSYFPDKLREFGGPYLTHPDGRVDLEQWNPKFWERVEFLHEYGAKKGVRFEDDVCDGWACKKSLAWHELEIPGYHPWIAKNNIQGLDVFGRCGKVEITAGSSDPAIRVYERWVRKVVEHTGKFGNVIYQDGNEILLVDYYSPAWTASIGNIIRDEEAVRGYKRHPFGTNAPRTSSELYQVDYVTVHTSTPITPQECNTEQKPCRNNEYNPSPPMRADQMRVLACDAKAKGYHWDFWRHGMSLFEAKRAWQLLNEPCQEVVSGCADIPNEGAIEINMPPSRYTQQINNTHINLTGSDRGPINMQQKAYQLVFAQRFRELYPDLCAGIQTDDHGLVDEVCVGTRQECQGYKIFNCKSAACPDDNPDCGCDSGTAQPAPQAARDAWRRP